jgi:tetratricopeptide (TPR) repeat protein
MLGNLEQASRYARVRVATARRRFGDWSSWTMDALLAQAQVEADAERPEEARKLLDEKVLPVYQYHCDEPPYDVSLQLGRLDLGQEDYASALPHLESAERALKQYNGEEELMSTALIWEPLGQALIGLDRAQEALPKLLAADRIYARDLDESDTNRQNVFYLLASAYEALGQPEEQARWQAKVLDDPDSGQEEREAAEDTASATSSEAATK